MGKSEHRRLQDRFPPMTPVMPAVPSDSTCTGRDPPSQSAPPSSSRVISNIVCLNPAFTNSRCAGSFRAVKPDYDFAINFKECMPDGVQIFSREAINEIGGICAEFKGMGQENREWHHRALSYGWNFAACNGIMDEIGSTHDGRALNPNLEKEIKESTEIYLALMDNKWKDFKWWESGWFEGKREKSLFEISSSPLTNV